MSGFVSLVRQMMFVWALALAAVIVMAAPGDAAAHTGHVGHVGHVRGAVATEAAVAHADTRAVQAEAAVPVEAATLDVVPVAFHAAASQGDCPMTGHALQHGGNNQDDHHQGDGGACCCVGHCTAHASLAVATPAAPVVFGPLASSTAMPGAMPDGIVHSPRLRPPQPAG